MDIIWLLLIWSDHSDESRTTYIGVYNTMAGLAKSVGPLMGGYLNGYGYLVIIISGILWIGYFVFKYNVLSSDATQME